ncbi:hypothetical protein [Metabacillus sp. 84]|uniref:hypothetical protein n=1 Tax=unclassified Metabacillus TaxID=2675274 RepID=UPI003CF8246B
MSKSGIISRQAAIRQFTYEYEIEQHKCTIDIHLALDPKGKQIYKVYVEDQNGLFRSSSSDQLKAKAVSKAILKYKWNCAV